MKAQNKEKPFVGEGQCPSRWLTFFVRSAKAEINHFCIVEAVQSRKIAGGALPLPYNAF